MDTDASVNKMVEKEGHITLKKKSSSVRRFQELSYEIVADKNSKKLSLHIWNLCSQQSSGNKEEAANPSSRRELLSTDSKLGYGDGSDLK